MKNNLLKCIIVLISFITSVSTATAADFMIGDLYYDINGDKKSVTVSSCKRVKYLIIPESVTYRGTSYSVTEIGMSAFGWSGDDLISVTIPNSITSIGSLAFQGCSSLASITIPNSVTVIGNKAFLGCSSLSTIYYNARNCDGFNSSNHPFKDCEKLSIINIGDSVEYIPEYFAYGLSSLSSVTIANGVTIIGRAAFKACEKLTSVTIPNSITAIREEAFSGCSSLSTIYYNARNCDGFNSSNHPFKDCKKLSIINIGEGVESIPNCFAYNLSSLTSVMIPSSVTNITPFAFNGCCSLTSIDFNARNCDDFYSSYHPFKGCDKLSSINIGDSVERIPANFAYGLSGLSSVTISNSVSSIGSSAFEGCSTLDSVIIPNGVISIEDSTFRKCNSLTSVEIPNSVTSIGNYAFQDCSSLASLTIPNSVTSIGNSAFFYCRSLISVEIPNSVISIGESAFANCNCLTSIEIPNSVTYIGSFAFQDCSSLASITIPNSVTSIGNCAFRDCSSLASLTIPNSVTSIGRFAFSYCSSLTSVEIPNSVISIGESAFANCNCLTSIEIPNSVTYIGSYAFAECSNLTLIDYNAKNCKDFDNNYPPFYGCARLATVKIGDGVEIIPAYFLYNPYTYAGISGLISLAIPNTVISIGKYAFCGCYRLVSIEIPNSVTSIGESAFAECNSLTSIEIPNSVISIGNYVFYNCSSLASVTIPNSVTSIGKSAFDYCRSLVSIEIPNSVTSIGESAFRDCQSLVSMVIPNSVTSIGKQAFEYCSSLKRIAYPKHLSSSIVLSSEKKIEYPSDGIIDENGLIFDKTKSFLYFSPLNATSVNIPNSVTEIGQKAFMGCDKITSLTIPNSVTSIGNKAFEGCTKLKSITFGSGLRTMEKNAFINTSIKKAFWLCNTPPTGASEVWASINCVANNNFTLPNTIVYPFLSSKFEVDGTIYVPVSPSERTCDVIDCNYDVMKTNIVVSDKVTNKGIQLKVLNINDYAFYDRKDIKDLKLLNKGTIGSNAFRGCDSLSNVGIDDGVTSLGDNVFYGCSAIKELVVPKSVTSIGESAFYGCKSITKVRFEKGNSKLTLGSNGSSPLFADCPLEEVYIGRDLSYQATSNSGYSPFYRNTTLTSVEITDAEDEIYDYEFYGCSNLKSLRIGNGVKSIGQYAFSGCSAMDFFSIGSNVKTIGDEAFSDCTSLTKFHTKAIVPPVCGTQALDDINKWECKLYVPDGSISQYQQADQWKDFFFVETSISGIKADNMNDPVLYYNLNGIKVEGNLTPGVYIKRQGGKAEKIFVK